MICEKEIIRLPERWGLTFLCLKFRFGLILLCLLPGEESVKDSLVFTENGKG